MLPCSRIWLTGHRLFQRLIEQRLGLLADGIQVARSTLLSHHCCSADLYKVLHSAMVSQHEHRSKLLAGLQGSGLNSHSPAVL